MAVPLACATNSPIELKTVLADLLQELPGDYDNAAQVYFEVATPESSGPPHDRVRLQFVRVLAPAVGEYLLSSTLRHGGKDGKVVDAESVVWTLKLDPVGKVVRMTPYHPRRPFDAVAAWSSVDLAPAEGHCTILWRKYGNAIRGTAETASCGRSPAREYVLTPEELWVTHLPADPGRTVVQKPAAESHYRLGKARDFECLLSFQPGKGQGEAQISNGKRMDDRGDRLIWETAAPNRHRFEYELLRGMWPSESGRNFTDLLRITMYEIDLDRPAERKLRGTGWASAASDRVSFGDGTYGVRCKLFDPSMPPPQ
jgi:hypothetical protein